MLTAVLMAGGSGARLWPLSRKAYPKQFLSLFGDQTMLQKTLERLSSLSIRSSIAICNENHRFLMAEQLREMQYASSIVLEPEGRNTAPAITLAALSSDASDLLLVLPLDHYYEDFDAFANAVNMAIPIAKSGSLVSFGVTPDDANCGYGYIKAGKKERCGYVIDEFHEKPSSEDARKYVASGKYYWNSGCFLFSAGSYLQELKKFQPKILKFCKLSLSKARSDLDFLRVDPLSFGFCPNLSIDLAVMEQTSKGIIVPFKAGWTDIGSWSTVWAKTQKDKHNNASLGDVIVHKSANSYIRSECNLVATVGVDNLIVVVSKDAVLVAHRDSAQDIKVVAEKLDLEHRYESQHNLCVYRPWGSYESLDNGRGYQVKSINVNPGGKLSLQKHQHRTEHWIVVAGFALVTKGEDKFLLNKNESTFIPAGTIHRLENIGEESLRLIEVQSGDYLGEDDIIRYADHYGRC